jgi:hypothetical protein
MNLNVLKKPKLLAFGVPAMLMSQCAPQQCAPTPGPAPAPPTRQCDPNYSGCVPIDSDVDCSGGSGNGPSYVSGPVRVIGSDIYGLDNDNDGIGCE